MAGCTLEALEWHVVRACLSGCERVSAAIGGVLVQGAPQEQLALSLLVMLAQQRRYISVQTQTGPLKLITELLDRAQESLHLVRRGSTSLSLPSGCSNFLSPDKTGANWLWTLDVSVTPARRVLQQPVPADAQPSIIVGCHAVCGVSELSDAPGGL